ncbi:MAG: MMPL family transporter [Deltaproteobacteria bacterium]|nr:MMPL family transporter [Deltaproteobacteria bacterium]
MERFFARFSRLLLARRGLFITVTVIATLAAGYQLRNLRSDFSLQQLFETNDAGFDYLAEFRRLYGADDDLVGVLVLAPEIFRGEVIAYLRALTDDLRRHRQVRRVDSLTTVSDLLGDGQSVDTRPLAEQLASSPQMLVRFRQRALSSPLLRSRVVSGDGTTTIIAVRLQHGVERAADVRRAVEDIEQRIAQRKRPQGVRLALVGVPVVRTAVVRGIADDQLRFLPLGSALTLLALLVLYRSFHGIAIPLVAIGLSTLFSVALMSALGHPLDILTNLLPLLVMVYGVADAVHMLGRAHEEMRAGRTREQAISATVRHLGVACFLTSATTAIGFGSLQAASMEVLRRFGFFAAAGVLMAYLLTIVVVPLGISVLRVDPDRTARATAGKLIAPLLSRLASWVNRWPRMIFFGGVFVALCGLVAAPLVPVDNYLLGIYADDHPTAKATRIVESKLQGVVSMQVGLVCQRGTLKRPAVLEALSTLERWTLRQSGVTGVIGPQTIVRESHRALFGRPGLPSSQQAVAQLLLMSEGDRSTPPLMLYGYKRGRVLVNLRDIGAKRYLAIAAAMQHQARRLLAPLGVEAVVTGTSKAAYRGIDQLVHSLLFSLGWAVVLIALVLIAAFRSWRIGLVSLIPNAMPLLAGVLFMALFRMRLDPTTAMTFTIALGIAVDDTIHFISRYRTECRAGHSPQRAVERTMRTAGRAMLITSAVLILGFSVTLSSTFVTSQRFGVLSCVIFFVAIVTDLTVTPACMQLFRVFEQKEARWGGRAD